MKWVGVVWQGRDPAVHPTTAVRAFAREGFDAKLRRPREKQQRTAKAKAERTEICGRMRRWPLTKFTDEFDMIIDNKRFDVPTTPEARLYQDKQKVVAQLQTRNEGLRNGFTKPARSSV